MNKNKTFSFESFINELRATLKDDYNRAVWPIAGFTLLFCAIGVLLAYFLMMLSSSMMMNVMMVMYGMASPAAILMAVLEILVVIVLMILNGFWYSFMGTAFNFTYLDRFRDDSQKVTANSIWHQFKHMNKNQVLRAVLYMALFMFLWSLPLTIVADIFARNRVIYIICQVANQVVMVWKGLEYSQSLFLYKDTRKQFLGQSMRHALTASRRFMGGLKRHLLLMDIVVIVLPLLVWDVIFGGLGYYGIYTATNFCIWAGFLLAFIGDLAYVPVVSAATALFYHRTAGKRDLKQVFADTLKPVDQLTGEADDEAKKDSKKKDKDAEK